MISQSVSTSDYHTAGEPFRIVTDPPLELPGDSVADRRARAVNNEAAQELRRLLCFEPRGHADIYGGFLVPADDGDAHLGVLFWHKDGFSTASSLAGEIVATTTVDGRQAVIPQVTGLAPRTGEHTFIVDPTDPLVPGFVLR